MGRVAVAVVVAVLATVAVGRLILGHYPDEGPYVTVLPAHGVHVGDVVLLAVWALLLVGLWRWVRRRARAPQR